MNSTHLKNITHQPCLYLYEWDETREDGYRVLKFVALSFNLSNKDLICLN